MAKASLKLAAVDGRVVKEKPALPKNVFATKPTKKEIQPLAARLGHSALVVDPATGYYHLMRFSGAFDMHQHLGWKIAATYNQPVPRTAQTEIDEVISYASSGTIRGDDEGGDE